MRFRASTWIDFGSGVSSISCIGPRRGRDPCRAGRLGRHQRHHRGLAEGDPVQECRTGAFRDRRRGRRQPPPLCGGLWPRRRARAGAEYARRMQNPQKAFEIPQGDAPVQQVVLTGDAIDLTRLPFHVQHQYDGAPYISSAIDYSVDPVTGKRNVGCRRLMLRSRTTMRSNLTQMSDLKRMFLEAVERGEHLPVNFAIGSHPLDFLAACVRVSVDRRVRPRRHGARRAAADGARGVERPAWCRPTPRSSSRAISTRPATPRSKGPTASSSAITAPAHVDPVFHVTAITMRKDALHQTVLHGTRHIARTEHSHQCAILTEARIMQILERGRHRAGRGLCGAERERAPACARVAGARAAQGRRAPRSRRCLRSRSSSMSMSLDEDVDVFSDDDVEWAMANRFRADRDLVRGAGPDGIPDGRDGGSRPAHHQGRFRPDRAARASGVEARVVRAPRIDAGAALSRRSSRRSARGRCILPS